MNADHEARVQQLVNSGLTPAQARREARAERAEARAESAAAKANVKLGISVFKLLTRMFK